MKKELFKIVFIALFIIAAMSACKKEPENNKEPEITYMEPEMVQVEGGTFTMGCTENLCQEERELPAHKVTLSDFYISKYTVTQKEWEIIMNNNPSLFKGNDIPVHNIRCDDAQQYIAKLNAATGKNYRLPTEAEWEYAARGGNQSKGYIYSGSNNIDEVVWYGDNSYEFETNNMCPHPVGLKKANELGIYDMGGNVWECCSDWYDTYTNDSQTNPRGPKEGTFRVIRGSSWLNLAASLSRVSARWRRSPDLKGSDLGFRLVLDKE